MFKQRHYHIIFIILLNLALQFQFLYPAYVDSVRRYTDVSIHQKHLRRPSSEPLKTLTASR